jgi:predicted nucleic acid-binding protein
MKSTKSSMKIFLDTNVLLDVFQGRAPYYDCSARIWSLAESGKAEAFISAISFNNIHYIIRKHEGRECAQKAVEVLNANFSMVPLTQVVMGKAIQSKWPDFEDAIQFFSALSISADFIITRNIKDFPNDVLPISTPEIFLAHYSEMF